jgi:hypothetical protein
VSLEEAKTLPLEDAITLPLVSSIDTRNEVKATLYVAAVGGKVV